MQKNTGTITIVILLVLIFCAVIGATVFGWFGFKSIKDKETDAAKADEKDKPSTTPTLRSDEVLCSSPSILAHRYSINPEALVTLLEIGRIWTTTSKEAIIQYFKKTIDDDARRYGESVKWEVVTTDELRFVVRLGSGLGLTVEKMMQQYAIEYKKTCLENFRQFFPTIPIFRRNRSGSSNTTTSNGSTTSTITGIDEDKVLQAGSTGDEVKALQRLCNTIALKKKYASITVTGNFDTKTEIFVSKYMADIQTHLTIKTAKALAKTLYGIE